jgi:hypothetical protein
MYVCMRTCVCTKLCRMHVSTRSIYVFVFVCMCVHTHNRPCSSNDNYLATPLPHMCPHATTVYYPLCVLIILHNTTLLVKTQLLSSSSASWRFCNFLKLLCSISARSVGKTGSTTSPNLRSNVVLPEHILVYISVYMYYIF